MLIEHVIGSTITFSRHTFDIKTSIIVTFSMQDKLSHNNMSVGMEFPGEGVVGLLKQKM